MNSDSIIMIARSHLPSVFHMMVLAAVIFLASFIWALLPERFRFINQWGRNILKQAPSITTALGLFGTFYGLTDSLRSFGTEVEQIQMFVGELKSVFIYSILGIGSAAVFMVLNVVVNAIHHHRAQVEKHKAITQYHQQNKAIQQNNDAVINYLAAQLKVLNQISNQLKNQPIQDNTTAGSLNMPASSNVLAETQQFLYQQAQFTPYLAELSNIQETLSKTVSKLLIPYTNRSAEFQQELLNLISEKTDRQNDLIQQFHQQLIEQQKQQQTTFAQSNISSSDLHQQTTEHFSSPLDPFKKLEQELEELSNENKRLFANKFSN